MAGGWSGTVVLVVANDAEVDLCRVDDVPGAGLDVVDHLARLQLAARRLGWSIKVCEPNAALRGLLDLAGLRGVLCAGPGGPTALPLEAGGEPERGEQLGIEEVVDGRDPLA